MKYESFSKNQEILEARGSIPYWVIAARLGVHENTVRNWVKGEMDIERKNRVMAAIKEIKTELKAEK